PTPPGALVARLKILPLGFEPGDRFAYSNSGYVLLGLLVEKVSGRSYTDWLQANLFKPLGMHDTGYDVSSAMLPRLAHGYELDDDGRPIKARYIHMSVPYAAGALYSTVEDIRRFAAGLFRGNLLSPWTLETLLTS